MITPGTAKLKSPHAWDKARRCCTNTSMSVSVLNKENLLGIMLGGTALPAVHQALVSLRWTIDAS